MLRVLAVVLSVLTLAPAGEPVAYVLGSRGAVQVKRGGTSSPVTSGAPLFVSDVVQVPPGGLLLLKVERNEQVVRLDEDLELAVSELAALNAPQATKGLSQQLEALLTPGERKELGAERLAGFVVRPLAANVAAAQPESTVGRAALLARVQQKKEERELDRRLDRLTRDDRLFDDSDRQLKRETTPGFGCQGLCSGGIGIDARVQVGVVGRAGDTGDDGLESLEAQLRVPDEAVTACLLEQVQGLPPEVRAGLGPSLSVTLRRVGRTVEVALEAALPVSACVQAWADAAGTTLRDRQSLSVEVALP